MSPGNCYLTEKTGSHSVQLHQQPQLELCVGLLQIPEPHPLLSAVGKEQGLVIQVVPSKLRLRGMTVPDGLWRRVCLGLFGFTIDCRGQRMLGQLRLLFNLQGHVSIQEQLLNYANPPSQSLPYFLI